MKDSSNSSRDANAYRGLGSSMIIPKYSVLIEVSSYTYSKIKEDGVSTFGVMSGN